MKKTFVSIDSGFRLAGTSSSFSIVLATTIENVKRLSLESACIPYTFFDIRDTYHVPLQEAAQPIVAVTIPQKNYSPTQLAAQLAISLTAASLNFYTYTVSYDSQTGGYTISSTGSFQLAWTTDFYTNGNNQNYMYSVLGFSDLSVIRMPDPDTGYATSQVSSGVGMISTDYLMLTIRPAPSNYVTTSNQNAFATFFEPNVIPIGTTKTSIVRFWVGVGALKRRGDSFIETILSPSQIEKTKAEWTPVEIKGLNGKNFKKIRVI
jgi:hypothetical protein